MLKKRSTKELITESARELLRSVKTESITVRMIADNCGITPQTFYNHFRDKYEVIARIYTDAMSKFLMSSLDDWFYAKTEVILNDLPFYGHALDYAGQNSLRDTLIAFDTGKLLLHVPRSISEGSSEMKIVRMGLISMIYGQFGLFEAMESGRIDLTSEEFDTRFSTLKEGMMLWAPSIVVETLLNEPTCVSARWDEESESVVAAWV